MSGIKFEFEDNLSKYFTRLEALWDKEEKFIMKELMYSATGRLGDTYAPIPTRLMHEGKNGKAEYNYNPYLYESGQDASQWLYTKGETESEIIANYSGMRGHRANDRLKVWVEFSEEFLEEMAYGSTPEAAYAEVKQIDPKFRTLDRDYAFYQETGIDEWADSEDAEHIGFVKRGLEEASKEKIPNTLERQMGRILKLLTGE